MPMYEFECRLCGNITERFRPVIRAGEHLTSCDHCEGVADKVISQPNIQDEHPAWIDDNLRATIQDENEPPIETRTDLKKAEKEKGLVENPK